MSGRTLREMLVADRPAVAASFTGPIEPDRLAALVDRGLTVAELRVDRFASTDPAHAVAVARTFAGVPTIATVRSAAEGGGWSGDDDERVGVFEALLGHVDGIDVELSSTSILDRVVAAARSAGKVVIVSAHDFDATPSAAALDAIASDARSAGADVVKVAATPRSWADVRVLARFTLDQAEQGAIVIAMGELGSVSRVVFPALGSALTFVDAGQASAPGQLDLAETVALLRRFGLAGPDGDVLGA